MIPSAVEKEREGGLRYATAPFTLNFLFIY